ncbi:unnamed protein product, partial [Rotaria magnacalcarata]
SQSYLYASLTPPLVPSSVRIQASTSFTSHDRPTVPSIAIKPRPYSFRALNHTSHEIKKIQTNNTNDNNNTTTNSNNNTSQ